MSSLKPAFRHPETGKIVATDTIHDIEHPEVAQWENPEDGYVDEAGKFYTRQEAKERFSKGESVIYNAVDTKDIRGLHAEIEALAEQLELMAKAESTQKSLIIPHHHSSSMKAGSGVEDVPPARINPPGKDDPRKQDASLAKVSIPGKRKNKRPGIFGKKTESLVENHPSKDGVDKAELMDKKCKKCGELSKEEKCAKCGEMSLPMNKSAIIYSPDGKLDIQGKAKGAVLPEDKKIKEIDTSDVGEVKKGSVKDLRGKAMKKTELNKAIEPKNRHALAPWEMPATNPIKDKDGKTVTCGACARIGTSSSDKTPHSKDCPEGKESAEKAELNKSIEGDDGPSESEIAFDARKNKAHKFRAVDPSMYARTRDRETCAHCAESLGHKSHYNQFGQFYHQMDKAEPPMAKPPSGKNMGTAVPTSKPAAPKMPKMAAPNMGKGDFGMTDSGKANTLPQADAPALPKPKYTAEDLKAGKAALSAAKPGIFGKLQNKKQ